jgi:leader peptidase (prepilin peptidase) / N-methyltransferase
MPELLALIFAFLFGAIVGSFLNVCIFRLPDGESIVFPGSHCRLCKKSLAWFDNIPLVSYAALGGKCRFCTAVFSD